MNNNSNNLLKFSRSGVATASTGNDGFRNQHMGSNLNGEVGKRIKSDQMAPNQNQEGMVNISSNTTHSTFNQQHANNMLGTD